jgi:type I site-specific restriction-modification system R (restriction) subunit
MVKHLNDDSTSESTYTEIQNHAYNGIKPRNTDRKSRRNIYEQKTKAAVIKQNTQKNEQSKKQQNAELEKQELEKANQTRLNAERIKNQSNMTNKNSLLTADLTQFTKNPISRNENDQPEKPDYSQKQEITEDDMDVDPVSENVVEDFPP